MIVSALALILIAQPTMAQRLGLPGLDLDGWDVAERHEGGVLTLTHPALGDQIPNLPQVWIRTEPLGPEAKGSSLQLVEFNCAARRMRVREAYTYPLKDLGGRKHRLPTTQETWRPLPAQAWFKPLFDSACEDQE